MKNSYIPKRDGDLNSFEIDFLEKLNLHAPLLEISASDLDKTNNILEAHKTAYALMNSKRSESKSATEGNALKKSEAISEIRRMSKLVKGSQKYTTEIGTALGLIGSDKPYIDYSDLKAEIKATVDGMNVIIRFRKNGTDGIKLYSKRGSESEFKYLSIDTSSPYVDTREKEEPGKPEQREYYAFYFIEDTEVGVRSDILKVIVP